MTNSTRQSALASRHRTLGSELEDWNGMGTAWSYDTDPNDEHDAVREAAGMFDMSPLKKHFIRGADALDVVNHMFSRDMTAVAPGQSAYGAVLNDAGKVCDDAIVANCNGSEFLLCHGTGASSQMLHESAQGKDVDIEFDDDLHNIAVQGPKALPVLNAHTPAALETLKYFHHQKTELFGHPCRISRTGYSGERGYEIFAGSDIIGDIWDQILGEGTPMGVMPCSFTALDKVRIEAALLFFGYDMNDDHSPWEVGLGFTINRKKPEYRGMQAALALEGKERFLQAGLVVLHDDVLAGEEKLFYQDQEVGVVNSPCRSHRMNQSLALAHVRPDAAQPGTELEVRSDGLSCEAVVSLMPFYDPKKIKTHQ